jgi:hypothetical protein
MAAAKCLFEAIRTADYDHDWLGTIDRKHFSAKEIQYKVNENRSGWDAGCEQNSRQIP